MARTALDTIRSFVERLAPEQVCDDCITQRLGLSLRQPTGHKINELAGADGFISGQGACSLCGIAGKVIRKAR